ncbi:hypothetical protein [Neorhizobium petrolearium]|uniref:hypothetical protein n=1 Tax=Neorhizobium petrolearium TaxID=515361 RepID=UPI003F800460
MTKVSIQSQIAAVEAAAFGKAATYRGTQKDLHQEHLRAAAQTLRFVRRNEDAIREMAEGRKGGAE